MTAAWAGGPIDASQESDLSVAELVEDLRDVLRKAFDGLWVRGEVHRPFKSRRGHLYFELVEKGTGDEVVGKLDAVLFRSDAQRLERQLRQAGADLAEGRAVRCFGRLDVYPPTGRLQLVCRDLDPLWSLGDLERRRRETLDALRAAGLIERNRRLPLVDPPLRLGLVTAAESAAYHDVVSGLEASGFRFRVLFAAAAVRGLAAEREIPLAIDRLCRWSAEAASPLHALLLVRGGGARSELAAFDSRAVAEAVARSPLPVLTGLGHEIDRSLVDLVAHRSFKTPTMVAEFVVERAAETRRRIDALASELAIAAGRRLQLARLRMEKTQEGAGRAALRLEATRRRLEDLAIFLDRLARRRLRVARGAVDTLSARLGPSARAALTRAAPRPTKIGARLVGSATRQLAERERVLDALGRLCQELAPERVLERGYSLTYDDEGRLLRRADRVAVGGSITTRLASGEVTSRVESLEMP